MRILPLGLAAWAALVLVAAPARAMQRPDILLAAGHTLHVAGNPNDGGLSGSLAMMWRVEPPFTAGLVLSADDCGTNLGHITDVNNGSDLGAVEVLHRFAYGAAWRLDAELPEDGRWMPFVSVSWGAYRVQDDVRGVVLRAVTSTAVGLGAGFRYPIMNSGALGVSYRWMLLQRGPSSGWMSSAVDWQWYWGRKP